jgi:hypothetical protein
MFWKFQAEVHHDLESGSEIGIISKTPQYSATDPPDLMQGHREAKATRMALVCELFAITATNMSVVYTRNAVTSGLNLCTNSLFPMHNSTNSIYLGRSFVGITHSLHLHFERGVHTPGMGIGV